MPTYIAGDDELPVNDVGPWAKTKLKMLTNYVHASSAARKKYQHNSPAYIDVFCGAGRSKIRDTNEFIDGSPIAAFKQSTVAGVPFSEVHISDRDAVFADATELRAKNLKAPVHKYVGDAEQSLKRIVGKLNPYGLHFAFLDPFSLGNLSFTLFETLSKLRYIDILAHVSAFDMQRNINSYSAAERKELDSFAPDWREEIGSKPNQFANRAALIEYWSRKVKALGFKRTEYEPLISAPGGQRLYWLIFLSRNEFARELWEKIKPEKQGYLDL